MSGGSRKRLLGGDYVSAVNNDVKIRREQLLPEAELFGYIDDVTMELRSIESQVNSDAFQRILKRLDRSETLVRRKQNTQTNNRQDSNHMLDNVAQNDSSEGIEPSHRETEPLQDVEQQAATIEKEVEEVESKPEVQNNSNSLLKNVMQNCSSELQGTLQQEQHPLQAVEKPASKIKKEIQEVVDVKPDVQNNVVQTNGLELQKTLQQAQLPLKLRAFCQGLASSAAVKEEPLKFSNRLKNVAQINFNAEFLKKMEQYRNLHRNANAVEEVCEMVKQRMALIEHPQFEYNAEDQQQFNNELTLKLRCLRPEVSGNDEYQQMCPFVQYLSDLDLLMCIVNNSDSAAAQHILRARSLWLKRISFESKIDRLVLKLNDSMIRERTAGAAGETFRRFKFGMDVNKKVDSRHLLRLFRIILQFYEVSQASILLFNCGSSREFFYNLLVSTFGAPPTDRNTKIRIKEMIVEAPEVIDFLQWFSPTTLTVGRNLSRLVNDPSLASMTSLISGVDVIKCSKMNADRLLEELKAPVMIVQRKATWSDKSVLRVLKAHRLSWENGFPRAIKYKCHRKNHYFKSVKEWKQFFESWSRSFEEEYGKIGRNVPLNDDADWVTLTLH